MSFSDLKILVVDDEEAMREVLRSRLSAWGIEVRTASDLAEAEDELARYTPDTIICDVMLPDGSGVDLLAAIRRRSEAIPVVLVTAHGTVDLAVEAMRGGALDFITKPIDYDRLRDAIEAAQAELRSRRRKLDIESEEATGRLGDLIGRTRVMRELFAIISEIAPTKASVLITGESGTGKELVARTLHALSRRRAEAFIAINSAAIPTELVESELFGHEKGAFTGAVSQRRGCFELADRGTLFLDEIAEMPLELQPKLLRVLEDGRVRRVGAAREIDIDVRLVAATNRPPHEALERGQLRADLYYRLNVFELELPPLRTRRDDIGALAEHFIARLNRQHGTEVTSLSDDALEGLQSHDWPGNVRELRNILERTVVLHKTDSIELDHLPETFRHGGGATGGGLDLAAGMTLAEVERDLILGTLDATENNKAETARRLGIDVKTVRNKLKAWGIER